MRFAFIVIASSMLTPTDMVIWFEHDSVEISERGRQTLEHAILDGSAETEFSGAPPALVIEGHADRVGSQDYNLGLSRRRALAVRDRLIARGYPEAAISTVGYGESAPLVPTEDNLPEADNRRVEVRFVTGRRAGFCAGPVRCGHNN